MAGRGTQTAPPAVTAAAPVGKPGRKSDKTLSERATVIVDAIRTHKGRVADAQRKLDKLTAAMSDSEFEAFTKEITEAPAAATSRLVI